MKKIWEIGIVESDTTQQKDDVRLTNIFALIGFFFAAFKGLTLIYLGLEKPFFLITAVGSLLFLVFLTNYYRRIDISKILIWIIPHIIIFVISSSVGYKGQCHTLLVHLIVVGNVLNYHLSWTKHVGMVVLTMFFGITLYLTNFSMLQSEEITDEVYYYIAMNTFFTHLLGGGSIVLILIKRIKDKYREADTAQEALGFKYDEILKVNQELDRFVYSVSHDLRAPIASALGLVDIVKKEEEVKEIRKYLSLQEQTLLKLDGFIKDILAYSQNARMNLVVEKIDFAELLSDMIPLLMPSDQTQAVDLRFNFDGNARVQTDKLRLQFILKNLITNAILYRNKKHPHPFVEVNITTNLEGVNIFILDNGMGIEQKHLPHIFQMFYRANTVTKGSGLGLYIVKEMLDKLGGKIEVQSKLGEGTQFSLFIPHLPLTQATTHPLPSPISIN